MAGNHEMRDVVLFGVEGTPGTIAVSTPLDLAFLSPGLVPTRTPQLAEIRANSTFPNVTDLIPLGVTAGLSFSPALNRDNIRDIILMSKRNSSGLLPILSILSKQAAVGDYKYLGCMVSALTLEYSRGGASDQASILKAMMNFEVTSHDAHTGIAAGTKAEGRRFRLDRLVATINSVATYKVLQFSYSLRNTIHLLTPDSANTRLILPVPGDLEEEFSLRAVFENVNLQTLLLAGTEHAASFVHGTGTLNETVTQTIAAGQISGETLGREESLLTADISIKVRQSGATQPVVWAFGSAIGASALSLS